MKKPELLSPAGNLEKLITAIDFGADAVYIGGSKLNLRAFADNFDNEELRKGIEYAHERNKKVYVTLNVFAHNEDLQGLEDYLTELYEMKVDAIIVSDPGIIMTAREVVPELEIHLSTQANNVNYRSAIFWHKQGVKRIVLARELSMEEIKDIRSKIPDSIELEAFVHGAMCMAYSGRCLLSNYIVGRDSNRGQCAQPCRYKYYLQEEKRTDEKFEIREDERGSYILNSKDLCMIEHIPELFDAGIDSFKIEGRMKSVFYVASVTKAYREAIDEYYKNPCQYKYNEKWMDYLMKPSHRKYYTGFYFNDEDKQVYNSSAYEKSYDVIGVVKSFDKESMIATLEQKNKACVGDTLEVLRAQGNNEEIRLLEMRNERGQEIQSCAAAKMIFTVKVDKELSEKDILIKAK
ncbi:putative protease [Hathewaya proteolytica DSM 3090]|uniref:Putative protease n=1 Tax=Hathewaya proteolytica DSM 3090 TaxID=1121331 RepID=A0A1M6JCH2_9CLOT|nr:U32 family peptidase [Hathewaya proteolytica]SHJ44405.1 putative protease [Hathewaya proteolytica DSM 3090]